jgi:hypothetical protein
MNSVVKYFNERKAESYIFINRVIASPLFRIKDFFWKGIAIPFIIVVLLEFIVVIP